MYRGWQGRHVGIRVDLWVVRVVVMMHRRRKMVRVCCHEGGRLPQHVSGGSLETLPPSQKAAIIEHILAGWVEGPVVSLARVSRLSGNLDETVIEREIMANTVLPGWKLLPEVRESVHDELANTTECQSFLRRL